MTLDVPLTYSSSGGSYVGDGRFHLESIMIANPTVPAFRYDPYDKKFTREVYDHAEMREVRAEAVGRARKSLVGSSTNPSGEVEEGKGSGAWAVVLGTLGRQGSISVLNVSAQRLHRLLCLPRADSLSKEHYELDSEVESFGPRPTADPHQRALACKARHVPALDQHLCSDVVPPSLNRLGHGLRPAGADAIRGCTRRWAGWPGRSAVGQGWLGSWLCGQHSGNVPDGLLCRRLAWPVDAPTWHGPTEAYPGECRLISMNVYQVLKESSRRPEGICARRQVLVRFSNDAKSGPACRHIEALVRAAILREVYRRTGLASGAARQAVSHPTHPLRARWSR